MSLRSKQNNLIRKVAEKIKNEWQFYDQSVFGVLNRKEPENLCKTTACIAGHCCILANKVKVKKLWDIPRVELVGNNQGFVRTASGLMGLPQWFATALFHGSFKTKYKSKKVNAYEIANFLNDLSYSKKDDLSLLIFAISHESLNQKTTKELFIKYYKEEQGDF
jgi:hypothetical protein